MSRRGTASSASKPSAWAGPRRRVRSSGTGIGQRIDKHCAFPNWTPRKKLRRVSSVGSQIGRRSLEVAPAAFCFCHAALVTARRSNGWRNVAISETLSRSVFIVSRVKSGQVYVGYGASLCPRMNLIARDIICAVQKGLKVPSAPV